MATISAIHFKATRIVPQRGRFRVGDETCLKLEAAINAARHEDCKPPLTDEEMQAVKDAYEDAAIEREGNRKTKRYV